MLQQAPVVVTKASKEGAIVVMMESDVLSNAPWPPAPKEEGYTIRRSACATDKSCIAIIGKSGPGALYGAFKLLNMVRREQADLLSKDLSLHDEPKTPMRMWDMWDNRDRTIERGYSGGSVFNMNALPTMFHRYEDYARLLSSTGINAVVWNNVNACVHGNSGYLKEENIKNMAPLVKLFMDYGVRSFITPCYGAPVKMGGLKTLDPMNEGVAKFWEDKAMTFKKSWPSKAFGGFLIKADTEGMVGPEAYGRTELDGANAMGKALSKVGGIVIWRAFGHPWDKSGSQDAKAKDQAYYQFNRFKTWDGKTRDNVVLQIKNGPFDFQAREPVHSLFSALKNTNLMVEMLATQEYLGQAKHVAHLPTQWEYYLKFNLGQKNLGEIVTSKPYSGMAAVSNLGAEKTWTGHPFSAGNTYGFGRLAWDPSLSADMVTKEWVEATFGVDEEATKPLVKLLMNSWNNYEKYTSPLGWGWSTSEKIEYGKASKRPELQHYHLQLEWAGKVWIKTGPRSLGYDRSKGYAGTYEPEVAHQIENVDTCPEELLLAFHNVPYDHKLKSKGGARVIDYILDSYKSGAEATKQYVATWKSLKGKVDCDESTGMSFDEITDKLEKGVKEAEHFAADGQKYFRQKGAAFLRLPPTAK
jgi:alpha-glucuronidase